MKKYVIFDIDGTISEFSERRKEFLKKEDWYNFHHYCYEDKPIKDVIDVVKVLSRQYIPIFCTGRTAYESVIIRTINWIAEHIGIGCEYGVNLLMRKIDDFRKDTEVKPELLKYADIYPYDVLCILEDREEMVDKWRELGFTCLQPTREKYI
jgi:FMN phosphatase YigB (HAD superfamily)